MRRASSLTLFIVGNMPVIPILTIKIELSKYDKCNTQVLIVLTTENKSPSVYLNHEQSGRDILPNKCDSTAQLFSELRLTYRKRSRNHMNTTIILENEQV